MKLKKLALRALGGLMTVALAACMLTSCNKDGGSSDKLVENIPSSAVFVLKMNPQQVFENAGCSVDNGKIILSEKYSDAIRKNAGGAALKIVTEYLTYTEGLKLDAIMFFSTQESGNDVALVGLVSDAAPVKAHLKELVGNQKEENGYDVFNIGGSVVAVSDNMIWIARNMRTIEKHIADAAKSNIASVKGLGEFLAQDNALAFAISLPEINKSLKAQGIDIEEKLTADGVSSPLAAKLAGVMDYYACGSLKFEGNTASGEMFLVNEAGERNEFGKILNVIDTGFLANVPADVNGVMAMGNIADADIKAQIDSSVADYKSRYGNTDGAQYLDLITCWDGTAAFAVECNKLTVMDPMSMMKMSQNEIIETVFNNLKFVAMVHYPQEIVKNYTDMLSDLIQSNGVAATQAADGFYSVELPDMFNLYYGDRNGYLTFANYEAAGNSMSLADKFAGKRVVIYSRSEANPVMARFGWNFGSEGMLWLDADAVRLRTELTGTSANFLQAIIEPLTDINNLQNLMQYGAEMNGMYDMSDDDYAYDDYYDSYDDAETAVEL